MYTDKMPTKYQILGEIEKPVAQLEGAYCHIYEVADSNYVTNKKFARSVQIW